MFTGTPDELRKLKRKIANHADLITEQLNRIEDLGLHRPILLAGDRIVGPEFAIRRTSHGRWILED